jgi:hypothetical protein
MSDNAPHFATIQIRAPTLFMGYKLTVRRPSSEYPELKKKIAISHTTLARKRENSGEEVTLDHGARQGTVNRREIMVWITAYNRKMAKKAVF